MTLRIVSATPYRTDGSRIVTYAYVRHGAPRTSKGRGYKRGNTETYGCTCCGAEVRHYTDLIETDRGPVCSVCRSRQSGNDTGRAER